MPTIIRDLPFYDRSTSVQVRRQSAPVKREQIIVWVSLTEMGLHQLHSDTPRIPAILDIGCNHNFMIHERHLVEWVGIHAQYLRPLGKGFLDATAVTANTGTQKTRIDHSSFILHPSSFPSSSFAPCPK